MKAFPLRIIPSIFLLATIALSIFGVIMGYNSYREQVTRERAVLAVTSSRLDDIEELTEQFKDFGKTEIYEELYNRINEINSDSDVLAELVQLRLEIDRIREQTSGLRQSINPSNPEEILTIARLSDRLEFIEKEINSVTTNLEKNQLVFQDYIIREIQGIKSTTNTIYIAIIPLILNAVVSLYLVNKEKNK